MEMIRFLPTRILTLSAFLTVVAASAAPPLPFGAWHRGSETPVIAARGNGWESAGTFNPAVVARGDKIVMLYRAQDKQGTSRLGYAESGDGLHFTRRDEPVLSPTEDYEKDGGVEDPRLVQFGDTYYLTYTGFNKRDAQLCLATSKDLIHWDRRGIIIPVNKGNWNVKWTKSGAIVPKKIEGKYWMYFPGYQRRQQRSGRLGVVHRFASLDGGHTRSRITSKARPFRFACRRTRPRPHPRPEWNRSDLQRRGRQVGVSHRDRDFRSQRSAEIALAW
jgi:hypothetical protein